MTVTRPIGDVTSEVFTDLESTPEIPSLTLEAWNYRRRIQLPSHADVSGARATLACGSAKYWGFRHIKAGHLSQWEAKAALLGALWMDVAHWSMTNTLSTPCSKYRQLSNDTLQYVAPFQIRDSKGRVVQTYGVRVVVARQTQNIITSYPQTATC